MKLLLTSAGLTNKSISNALFEMVGKKPEETSLVFIPTASNLENDDKAWVTEDLVSLKNLNFKQIEIADISTLPENVWKPQLEKADVIYFEGGSTFHLMRWINKSGLDSMLPELLKTKVWVGVSAGSMVTSPDLLLTLSQVIYKEDLNETENLNGLGYVDFYFLPHLNSEYFSNVRRESIEQEAEGITKKIYVMDDEGALKVVDGEVEIVSEGEYFEVN